VAVEFGLVEFLRERLVGVRQLWVGLAWSGWAVKVRQVKEGYVKVCFGSLGMFSFGEVVLLS
jgi:hypothetical protein